MKIVKIQTRDKIFFSEEDKDVLNRLKISNLKIRYFFYEKAKQISVLEILDMKSQILV